MPYYFMIPFFLIFFTAFAFIIFAFVRSAKEAGHNARSPRLTVPARIVAKRTQIGGRAGSTGTHGYMTRYFATFEQFMLLGKPLCGFGKLCFNCSSAALGADSSTTAVIYCCNRIILRFFFAV